MSDVSRKPGFGFLTRSDSSQPEQLHIFERLSVKMLFEMMMFFYCSGGQNEKHYFTYEEKLE